MLRGRASTSSEGHGGWRVPGPGSATVDRGKSTSVNPVLLLEMLLVVSLSFMILSGGSSVLAAERATSRQYSRLPTETARAEAVRVVKSKLVPPPPGSLPVWAEGSWEVPEGGPTARGLRINQRDLVLFIPSLPSYLMLEQVREGLASFVKSLDKMIYDRERKVFRVGTEGSDSLPFVDNGILYSTVDMEVLAPNVLRVVDYEWKRAERIIPRGGWLVFVGPVGVELSNHMDALGKHKETSLLIAYEQPVPDFSFTPLPIHLLDFEIIRHSGRSAVRVQIRGRDIILR